MFHVHYKPLWAAIGEPDNRFRKPTAQGRMIERVMLLDAVLDDRDFTWLGPSTDKRRHFMRHLEDRLETRDYPHLLFGDGPTKAVRYFPDKLPIGVQPYAHPHVFVYLVTRPSPMDFRLFLLRHTALLRVVFRWTVRLLFPRKLWKARLAYQHAAREHLATPLHPSVVETLEWVFPERKRLAEPGAGPAGDRYREGSRVPSARRGIGLCTASGWRTRRTRSGWPARPSSLTPSTAATAKSSASSFHASTCISLPWLTSPDTHSRGRPGGRPREMRLSPQSRPTSPALRSAVLTCNSRGRWPQLTRHAQFAGRAGRHLSVWAAPFAAHWKARMSQSGQETWRERPGRARLQWPRACPEGSLTPCVSESRVDRPRVRSRCGSAAELG